MHVYVCVCYVCTHAYMCVCLDVCINVCMYVCIYVSVCVYVAPSGPRKKRAQLRLTIHAHIGHPVAKPSTHIENHPGVF